MKKNALTIITGILLVLYALINFGAGIGQFGKAKLVGGAASVAADVGRFAGENATAANIESDGTSVQIELYLIAFLIFAAAILELAGAVGLFSGQSWAFMIVIIAVICGFLVEFQDILEDGFGMGKAIFLGINALALITAISAKKPKEATT